MSYKNVCCKGTGEPCKCGVSCKFNKFFKLVHESFSTKEPNAKIDVKEVELLQAFSREDTQQIFDMINAMPHGPLRFS